MSAKPQTADQPAEVLYASADHVATITLNAPERMNTISGPMLKLLTEAFLRANQDEAVRAVILTGTGRAFCAGLNLQAQRQGTDSITVGSGVQPTNLDLRNTPPTVLQAMDKPVICALNGAAAGYGLDIALGCDIRIMASSAKLAASYAKRSVLPESGGTWYLPRLLGWSKAAELIFTGRTLSADESVAMGLASRAVADGELMGTARALAMEIAANAPLAVQAAKRMMRMGWNENFPDHVHHVYLQLLPLMKTEDFREALAAFAEKRAANFKGR